MNTDPIDQWDDPRADALLAQTAVIVGHWDGPPIDAALLDRAQSWVHRVCRRNG